METTLTVILIIQLYGLCAMKQHYYIDLDKTWDDALQYCRTNYDDLSSFTNETEEQQFIDATGQALGAWIGLSEEYGIWKWSGGEVATQISWDIGEPYDNCAFFNTGCMKVHTTLCMDEMPFFCMTLDFVVDQQTKSWEGALEYCRNHYEDLVSLSSVNSKDTALSKMTGTETQYVWIGLRFLAGEWFWLSGDDLQHQDWTNAKQPQCPAQNQRCGALDTKKKTWTNRDCEEKLNFLCF